MRPAIAVPPTSPAVDVPAPDAPARRLAGLDAIRAVAILLVMIHHFRSLAGCPEWLGWFALRGYIGVDLFFVLSGWLIGGQVLREAEQTGTVAVGRFWARRWFRTLPAYYAALVLMILTGKVSAANVPAMLVFAQNYTSPLDWLISWSLCIEEHVYAALPLLLLLVRRRPAAAWAFAVCAVAASPLLRWGAYAGMSAGTYPEFLGSFYSPTHLRLEGIALGVVLAAVRVHRPGQWAWLQRHAVPLAALGLVLVVGSTWWPALAGSGSSGLERMRFFPAVPGFTGASLGAALMIPFAARPGLGSARAWRPVIWVAEHAYTLYLFHEHALDVSRSAAHRAGLSFWVALPLAFALSFVLAWAVRQVIELPGLRLRDRVLRAQPAAIRA